MKPISNIEAEFRAVVRKIGGKLVTDLVHGSALTFENADFYFPEENVVAEFKILEKDPTEEDELQKKIQAKFDKWMSEGKLAIYGTVRVESKSLPNEMQWELMRVLSEPVRRVIKKANRQIRETKEFLKKPTAKGLVIIVNEANYELQPEHFAFAAHQSLNTDFSSVNGVSLLTVNIGVTTPQIPSSLRLWMDYLRKDGAALDEEFMRRLRRAWTDHYASLIGEYVPVLEHRAIDLASMKYKT